MTDTEQTGLTRDEKGRITGGHPPNGLDKNPQNRHNGAWKKEDTPRYKLEQMMKLSDAELGEVWNDVDAPLFERKLAQALKKGDWKTIREMTHEVYGTPKSSVDVTTGGDKIQPVQVVDLGAINADKHEAEPDSPSDNE